VNYECYGDYNEEYCRPREGFTCPSWEDCKRYTEELHGYIKAERVAMGRLM